jgi:hypothetical protein
VIKPAGNHECIMLSAPRGDWGEDHSRQTTLLLPAGLELTPMPAPQTLPHRISPKKDRIPGLQAGLHFHAATRGMYPGCIEVPSNSSTHSRQTSSRIGES